MRGVSTAQLRGAIYSQRGKIIDACLRNGDKAFEYTYDNFLTDIIRSGILKDDRTIKAKWVHLQKEGTVIRSGSETYLSALAFARLSHESVCEREINAHLQIQEGAQ